MKIEKAVCYSFHLQHENSLAHLRLIGPLVQAGINIINGIDGDQFIISRILDGDIVIIQREIPVKYNDYKMIVETAHNHGKPIVFDLDDLLFFLPENHPDRQAQNLISTFLPMYQAMKEADLVTVSTPKLGNVLRAYCSNVVVLPNYFDDRLWHLKSPVQMKSEDRVLTIGFMGGYTHKPDLEYIVPVLKDLIVRYPQRIRMQFWGLEPPEEIREFPQVTNTITFYQSYREFAVFFQKQIVDICIAPLVDNLFNRCKSPIKFFEYGALGVPGVYSHLDTYDEVVRHGENGFLASTLDEWREYLIQLIENDDLRYELACNAQESIRQGWLLSQNSFRWKEIYQGQAAVPLVEGNKEEADIIGSIHTQLFEAFRSKEREMENLRKREAEIENKLQALVFQVTERDRKIAEIENRLQDIVFQVTERDQKIKDLNSLVSERDQKIKDLNSHVLECENQIRDLVEKNKELEEEKNRAEIEAAQYAASTSWQITRPLRKIAGKFRRMR